MDCNSAGKIIHLYIERKLSGQTLEDFLDHVEHCPVCSEELEVNFSIYYALKQLSDDEEETFDMKQLLEKDMSISREILKEEDNQQFLSRLGKLGVILIALVFLALCVESGLRGGFHKTGFYKILSPETVVVSLETETETTSSKESEAETNHKKERVVTIPETEEKKTPGLIPDET